VALPWALSFKVVLCGGYYVAACMNSIKRLLCHSLVSSAMLFSKWVQNLPQGAKAPRCATS